MAVAAVVTAAVAVAAVPQQKPPVSLIDPGVAKRYNNDDVWWTHMTEVPICLENHHLVQQQEQCWTTPYTMPNILIKLHPIQTKGCWWMVLLRLTHLKCVDFEKGTTMNASPLRLVLLKEKPELCHMW